MYFVIDVYVLVLLMHYLYIFTDEHGCWFPFTEKTT
jgi:hypothetical protein